MSTTTSRRFRWLAPVAAAAVVLAGGVAVGAVTAVLDRGLPERSPEQLLVDLQTARVDGLSGTIVFRADLGLPELPGVAGLGEGTGPSMASLASGTHTLRVWYSAPDKARVALLGTLGETDIITNGRDVWIWESQENRAIHRTLPDDRSGRQGHLPGMTPPGTAVPGMGGMDPQQLARLALTMLSPTTDVSTDGSASVAGRDAYELILTPRDGGTLVRSVRLALDAEHRLPLRVQIFARGSADPVVEAAFTQISFDRPAAAQFVFNPPPGAEIVEAPSDVKPGAIKPKPDGIKPDGAPPGGDKPSDDGQSGARRDADDRRPAFAMLGSGWSTVIVVRPPASVAEGGPGQDEPGSPQSPGAWLEALGDILPPAPDGGSVLTSRLFSVLFTQDGRILFGAVPAERLYELANDPAAQLPR